MNKLLKFNQRAEQVDANTDDFSFGIILKNTEMSSFSFQIVNDNGEYIQFINLNEWKIYSISSSDYFSRKRIAFHYSDPNGLSRILETGGRTINFDENHGIDDMTRLLEHLLAHFHTISCFENIQGVINEAEKLEYHHAGGYLDHLYMST